jgi:hypothetical protein
MLCIFNTSKNGYEKVSLSKIDTDLINAFNQWDECAFPEYALKGLYTVGEVIRSLRFLKEMRLIKGDAPFKLTPRGKHVKKLL